MQMVKKHMQAQGTVRSHCPSIIAVNNPVCWPGFGATESIAGPKVKRRSHPENCLAVSCQISLVYNT